MKRRRSAGLIFVLVAAVGALVSFGIVGPDDASGCEGAPGTVDVVSAGEANAALTVFEVPPPVALAEETCPSQNATAPADQVVVPAGVFTAGCVPNERCAPAQSQVTLPAFAIDRNEVTVAQYRQCVTSGACTAASAGATNPGCNAGVTGRDNHPINCVSAAQAAAFCTSKQRRLPTNEEWEKAARGVGNGNVYPWGSAAPSCDRAVIAGCTAGITMPVGSKALGVSPFGVNDMVGNVMEWVAPTTESFRRGGSWQGSARTIGFRNGGAVGRDSNQVGFRCAGSVTNDGDGDGVADTTDNCRCTSNATQVDSDGDRRGDGCDRCDGRIYGGQVVLGIDELSLRRHRTQPTGLPVQLSLRTVATDDFVAVLNQMTRPNTFSLVEPGQQSLDCRGQQTGIYITTVDAPLFQTAPVEVRSQAAAIQAGSPDTYLIFASPTAVWLVGQRIRGVQHALYDFLEREGVRYLWPSPNWTDVPDPRTDLRLDLNVIRAPAVRSGFIFPQAGFGTHPRFDVYARENRWFDWIERLRIPGEVVHECGHNTDAFIRANLPEILADPLTRAVDNGVRTLGTTPNTIQLNITHHGSIPCGSPGAFTSFSRDGQNFCENSDFSPIGPTDGIVGRYAEFSRLAYLAKRDLIRNYRSVSGEPADGGSEGDAGPKDRFLLPYYGITSAGACAGFTNATTCVGSCSWDGTTCKRMPTASDRVYHWANSVARVVGREGGGVCMLAYGGHARVPEIPLQPNLTVLIAQDYIRESGLESSELNGAWVAKAQQTPGMSLGIRDYWAFPQPTLLDLPTSFTEQAAELKRQMLDSGMDVFAMESTIAGPVIGRQIYLFTRMAWDPDISVDAVLDDFYSHAVGPAKVPVARMFRRWDLQPRNPAFHLHFGEIAAMFADLREAQTLLAAPGGERYQARLRDLILYAEYLRRLYELESIAATSQAAVDVAGDRLMEHLWRTYPSMLVHTDRIAELLFHPRRASYGRPVPSACPWSCALPNPHPAGAVASGLPCTQGGGQCPTGENCAILRCDLAPNTIQGKWLYAGTARSTIYQGSGYNQAPFPTYDYSPTRSAYTDAEVDALLTQGSTSYPAGSSFTYHTFTGPLLPVATTRETGIIPGKDLIVYDSTETFALFVDSPTQAATFSVFTQIARNDAAAAVGKPPIRVLITRPDGSALPPVQLPYCDPVTGAGVSTNINLGAMEQAAGHQLVRGAYRLRLVVLGAGGSAKMVIPKQIAFAQVDNLHSSTASRALKQYFWVPPNVTTIAVFTYATTAHYFSFPNGPTGAASEVVAQRLGDNLQLIPVPAGQSGKVWAFSDTSASSVLFLNVPNTAAYTPGQVLAPSDAITPPP